MTTILRILVVEDDLIVARDIQQQLFELNYEPVGHTTRGEMAVRMAGELQPDLVLMDVRLAGTMDGISAARAIRTQYAVPVVFLTAYSTDDTRALAKLAEPFGYVLKPFTDQELRMALEFALHNHAAEARLKDKTRQLAALSHQMLDQQEAQSSQIAQALHEQLAQALTAIKINLQIPAAASTGTVTAGEREALRIVDDSLQWIRRMSLGLRPSILDDFGLVSALWWLGEKTLEQHGMKVRFRVPAALPRTDSRVETTCFRIVEQVLANIVRKCHGCRIHVYLYLHNGMLNMGIRVNGSDRTTECYDPGGLSLLGLQERAANVAGVLSAVRRPGQGCTVRLYCPWTELALGTDPNSVVSGLFVAETVPSK